jgi:hypothetical protein
MLPTHRIQEYACPQFRKPQLKFNDVQFSCMFEKKITTEIQIFLAW